MILTADQAAALLQIRPKTAKALAAAGEIPAAKVGECWRFDETQLREWLTARSRENLRPCPSRDVPVPRIGRSDSRSLGARLDAALSQPTAEKPSSSRKNFAVVTGGRSS